MAVVVVVAAGAPLGEVLRLVREDVATSLQLREKLLEEEDEEDEDVVEDEMIVKGRKAASYALPTRVLVTGDGGGLPLVEYLFAGEREADVVPRIAELLSWSEEVAGHCHVQLLETPWVGRKKVAPLAEVAKADGGSALACGVGAIALVAVAGVAMQLANR